MRYQRRNQHRKATLYTKKSRDIWIEKLNKLWRDLEMASEKVAKLIEDVKALTVLELSELVKALEEEFGVSAAAPVAVAAVGAPAAAAPAAAEEEKTEFDVVLKEIGPEKIKVIKVVRELTGLGLKEAKDLVDGAPSTVKEGASKEEAENMAAKLKEVGAVIELK
jgi:large subunit ribosomal protein L7/L12